MAFIKKKYLWIFFGILIIAIIVCVGIAGFIFRNDFNASLNNPNTITDEIVTTTPEINDENTKNLKAVSVLVQRSNEQECST